MEISIEMAKDFAIEAHLTRSTKPESKRLYGTLPYSKHLGDVDNVLIRFGYESDIELRSAAWLHDVLEDTNVSYDELSSKFGKPIADFVLAVSDDWWGENRKKRKERMLDKLRAMPDAIPVKVADRIANIEWSLLTNLSLLDMYIREQSTFEQCLRNGYDDAMRKHLEYLKRVGMFALFQHKYN